MALAPLEQPHHVDRLTSSDVPTLYLNPEALAECANRLSRGRCEIRKNSDSKDPLLEHLAIALTGELSRNEEARSFYYDSLSRALAAHLMTRYSMYGRALRGSDRSSSALSPVCLNRVLEYMQQNLNQPIRLKDLAREANLSPFHFSRQFKKATGDTPYQRLARMRVGRAITYLRDRELSIAQVADLVGYGSQSRFSVAFKRIAGQSPASFRRRL